VPPEKVALWLSAADVFVLASEREGSPNALREALACGCPAVVSDVGDMRQLLGPHTGVIVADRARPEQWRDAIQAALATPWDRAAIRAEAERHTWPSVAARVAAEWRDCIDGAVQKRPHATPPSA
jgi:glycosyltransferase involved in cell wall biosynthesis